MTLADLGHLSAGTEAEPFVDTPLTITDFVRYQGASGDMNPIHHDTEFAKRAGYDTPFAVGMLPAGILGSYLADWLGASRIREFRVRFREQAWPGDVLTYRARVTAIRPAESGRFVDVAAEIVRQTGSLYADASAVFLLEDD